VVEGKVESAAEPGREMTSGSCDNGNRDSDDSSRGNNTKLLDHDNDSRRISAFSLRVTVKTLLIMTNLTGVVQSTTICPYPWHLLHLATVLILKISLRLLFLLSIPAFLSLTSFLSRGGRVLDL